MIGRKRIKALAYGVARLLAMPAVLRYAITRRWLGRDEALRMTSESVAGKAGRMGVLIRRAFCEKVLAGVGADVYVGYGTLLSKTSATLGDRSYVGRYCTIGWAEIGDDAVIADGVQILSGGRQHERGIAEAMSGGAAIGENEPEFTKVKIGRGSWIGAGAIVMADVGESCVVAAGAVVTRPVADGVRVAGVPAKPMRNTDHEKCPSLAA